MTDLIKVAITLAVASIVSAFLISGRFTVVANRQGDNAIIYMVDRFTGHARLCLPNICRAIPEQRELTDAEVFGSPPVKGPWLDYQKKSN